MATIPDSHLDLVQNGQVVILATNSGNDYPQVTAVWFALDDDGVIGTSLNRARQKTRNLIADPHATLFFIDPANPYRTLEIRADAEVLDDADYAHAARVNAKYGSNLSDMDQPGESRVWVRYHPVKINTFG